MRHQAVLGVFLLSFLFAGCSNIYFLERTKVAISVEAASDPSEPFELTAGYKRKILAIVPPQEVVDVQEGGESKKDKKQLRGEALSLISRFEVEYLDDNIVGDIDLKNGMATGMAARKIAASPAAVNALLGMDAISCKTELISAENKTKRKAAAEYVKKLYKESDDVGLASLVHALHSEMPTDKNPKIDEKRKAIAQGLLRKISDTCTNKDVDRLVSQVELIKPDGAL